MIKKLTVFGFFCLFLFVFLPEKSFANTNDLVVSEIFNADSAKLLTKEAKIIIKGEVKSVKSSKGINNAIYVRASVLVSETLKGKISKKNITVEYKENDPDDFELLTEETPSLKQGEEVILFLTNSFWRKNVYYLVGGSSGKYAICADNTVKIGSSCDKESETIISDGENQDTENLVSIEKPATKTKTTGETKETIDELLNEIKNEINS